MLHVCFFLQGVWDGLAWMSTKALGCCTGSAGECFPWAWGLPLCKHDGLAMGRKHGVFWGLPGWQQAAGKRGMSLTLPFSSGTPHHVRMLTSPFTTAAAADSGEDSFYYYQHFFQCPTTRAAYRDVPERRDCT